MSFFDCLQASGPFLPIGWTHILDLQGYDHMLFVIALCCVYRATEWKRIAWLVTAFTLGHSLTLLLAVKGWVSVPSDWVEWLIPLTILWTALHNIWQTIKAPTKNQQHIQYGLAAGFGLIHGLGFSNYLRAMLLEGQCLSGPLAYFNIGLELGQLLIVSLFMALSWLTLERLAFPQARWIQVISGTIAFVSLYLIFG